jgi:hypothetical protein
MASRNLYGRISGTRSRSLAAAVGCGAIVVMGAFTVTHGGLTPDPARITSDSGDETKFPPYSSPAVPAMKTASNMSLGATTTTEAPESAPAVEKAVPALKATPG